MLVIEILFWASFGLLALTHIVYPLLWMLLSRLHSDGDLAESNGTQPKVSLIIACHNEEEVIEAKLENALSLDYPAEQYEVLVACDGCTDRTVELASKLAADHDRISVLDMPRSGKVRTQDRAVKCAQGELVAFSDANSFWETDALSRLVSRFADPEIGYICGKVTFETPSGDNREGLYWRYEMALRECESRVSSVTAGNGAIYATRRKSYIEVDPRMGHDLSFPFNMVKRGWKAVFEPKAGASEKMVPSIEGEFRRKRRMMSHMWPILVSGGMLNPSGYSPIYAFQIFAHRLLRYVSPFLHLVMLATSVALVALGAAAVFTVVLAAQLAFFLLAAMYPLSGGRIKVLSVPYYYMLVTVAILLGLKDWITSGTPAYWEKAEGTR